jgi:molybdenum cofactor sulfurtransferase
MNQMEMEYASFVKNYPSYVNLSLDQLRLTQYPKLKDICYADWTGAAIPPQVLLETHLEFLKNNLLGNPHSHHEPSSFAMGLVKQTRAAVLQFFNADPDEYEVIFTANATKAIELLENYIFVGGELLLTSDNHNSMNGLREIAKRNGAIMRYSPIKDDLTFDEEALKRSLDFPRSNGNKLFGFPGKSNYSGIIHSLEWVEYAQLKGWDVLLDAAAFLANNRLDLGILKPDFVPVSFYKIFGYPTGIGCLIIKKSKYEKLHKKWFSGGSILLVSVMKDFYAPETIGYARFEDGTINFAGIPAIKNGLEFIAGLGDVKGRVVSLASWLYDKLSSTEGVIVHNRKGTDTVTFSVTNQGGKIIDAWNFEQAANEEGIYVRTGCFCNPGVNEKVFGYEIDSYENFYNDRILPSQMTIKHLRKFSGDKPIGAIRASFGFANDFSDVYKFFQVTQNVISSL